MDLIMNKNPCKRQEKQEKPLEVDTKNIPRPHLKPQATSAVWQRKPNPGKEEPHPA
jgi:hypothetical protein